MKSKVNKVTGMTLEQIDSRNAAWEQRVNGNTDDVQEFIQTIKEYYKDKPKPKEYDRLLDRDMYK